MSDLKAEDAIALQFLMTEELYLVDPLTKIVVTKGGSEGLKAEDPALVYESAEVEESVAFDYLGENNKYFGILVNYPGQQYMAQKELEALLSILGAKKMDIKDVALVNMNKYPSASFSQLKSFLALNRMVLFGVNPAHLQLPAFPLNQISEHEGVRVLVSFGFSEMMSDVEKKKAFWNVMKGF